LVLTACPDDSNKRATTPTVVEKPPVVNPIVTDPTLLRASTISDNGQVQLLTHYFASTTGSTQIDGKGVIHIKAPIGFGNCTIPAGRFTLEPMTPGEQQGFTKSIFNVTMKATGANFLVQVSKGILLGLPNATTAQPVLGCDGVTYHTELVGDVYLLPTQPSGPSFCSQYVGFSDLNHAKACQ
jgi:hypothetical protein